MPVVELGNRNHRLKKLTREGKKEHNIVLEWSEISI